MTTATGPSHPMRSIATDLLAGVLVGVVLVPTAMAFGVIAGLGPAAGLYGAIVLGLLAAITGNTRGLISGPNIFVALVLASVVSEQGVAAGFTAAVVSGVFLMVFGLVRLGRFIVYIPTRCCRGSSPPRALFWYSPRFSQPLVCLQPRAVLSAASKRGPAQRSILTPLLLPG